MAEHPCISFISNGPRDEHDEEGHSLPVRVAVVGSLVPPLVDGVVHEEDESEPFTNCTTWSCKLSFSYNQCPLERAHLLSTDSGDLDRGKTSPIFSRGFLPRNDNRDPR